MIRTTTIDIVLAGVGLMLLWLLLQSFRKRIPFPYPPGPKGLPFLGNIDIPPEHQWLRLTELNKEYGDIFSLTIFGQKIIVLGSVETVTELFDKRPTNYSSRPEAYMLRHLMGYDRLLAFMPYGDIWKHQRNVFESYFRQREIPKFHQTLIRETHMMLHHLLEAPERFLEHCRLLFGATILDIVYGLKNVGHEDPIFITAELSIQSLGEAAIPGRFWVEQIPLMRYIPAWMPGAGFQRKARIWRSWGEDFLNIPWNRAKQNMQHGTVQPSFASKMIEKLDGDDASSLEQETFKPVAAIAYAGGSDTTVATLQSIFLAMCLFPNVLKRAQAELDRVVGEHRLPTFGDKLQLPYINALMKAVPHFSLEDDVYRGYFIPKGSLVIGNSWGLLHDPALFGPNTDDFSPERFLSEDQQLNPNMPDTIFGFGYGPLHRRCPGRHLSEATLFISVASIIHTFNITPPVDENGIEIKLEARQGPNMLSPPAKFACVIKPRSEAAAALIQNLGL
ncbi:putative CyP450 monooxygenase [Mycena floridula]|nr:putative CyP450 monooxygenase [Mycena floridula]